MLVETLKVLLTGDSKQLESALQRSSAAAKKFGRDMNQASQAMTKAAAVLSGFGALMVREASKWDTQVAGAVKSLKNQYSNLALEIGRALVPVLETMSRLMSQVVNWLRSIDPETKKWAAGLLAASTALFLVGAGVTKVIAVGAGMAAALLPVLPALAAIVAAVGAVYLATVVLRTFWKDEWQTMVDFVVTDVVPNLIRDVKEGFRLMANAVWDVFVKPADDAFKFLLNQLAAVLNLMAKIPMAPDWVKNLAVTVQEATDKGLRGAFEEALDAATKGAIDFGAELERGAKRVGSTIKEDIAAAKRLWERMTAGAAPSAGPGTDRKMFDPSRTVRDPSYEYAGLGGYELERRKREAEDKKRAELGRPTKPELTHTLGAQVGAGASQAGSMLGLAGAGSFLTTLLTGAKEFETVANVVSTVVSMLAQVFNQAWKPFTALFGAVKLLVPAVVKIAGPFFGLLQGFIGPFAAIVVVLAEIFSALTPVLRLLMMAVALITSPIQVLVTLALPLLFEAIRFVGLGILHFAKTIAPIWNGIISSVQAVLQNLAAINIGGWKPLEFLKGWAVELDKVKLPVDDLRESIKNLEDMTFGSAMAKANEAAAAKDAADATRDNANAQADAAKQIEEFSESLTNVPEGFKVAAARYGAIDTGSSGSTDPVDLIAKKQRVNVQVFIDSKEIAATMRTTQPQHNASYGQPVMEGI